MGSALDLRKILARSRMILLLRTVVLTLPALLPLYCSTATAGVEDDYATPPAWAHHWWFPGSRVLEAVEKKTPPPQTTYERLIPLAQAGDPETQNFIGFMFFQGEAVDQDYDKAHYWFHQAAEEGHPRAQRNLGILHARSLPDIPERFYNPEEANLWLSLAATASPHANAAEVASSAYSQFLNPKRVTQGVEDSGGEGPLIGEKVFTSLCAGCHGFDGHAAYPAAPSFALHEALDQPDATLLNSILNGKNIMPAWKDTLSPALARKVLQYIRYRFGTDRVLVVENSGPVAGSRSLVPEVSQPETPKPELSEGQKMYERFCAGCHGFNGISYYVNSPSFALRERLHKSNDELAHSVAKGLNAMPSWGFLLKPDAIHAILRYVRTLAPTYEQGIAVKKRQPQDRYFRFRPFGEEGPEWDGADPMGVRPPPKFYLPEKSLP